MTDAQTEALETVQKILGEHFDSAIVACTYDVTTDADPIMHDSKYLWFHGGLMTCLGLSEWAKHTFLYEEPTQSE